MKTIVKLSLFFSFLIVVLNACKKDRDDTPTPTNPTSIVVPVSGTVVDVYGQPLADVTVKAGNYTTTTDYTGSFYLPTANFGTSRYIITFEKTGYFTLTRSGIPQPGKPINLAIGLIDENNTTYAAQKNFNSAQADSIVLPDGSIVSFPANAFMNLNGTPYNGMVTVKACYLDPTWDNYGMFVFGGDLYGKDLNNNDVMLNPFSGLNVLLYDNAGNKIQLDTINHKEATVKMQIPAPLVNNAPTNIETWEYAPAQGQQVQRGQAGKHGDKYVGQVAHFSFWSCQKPHTGKATIWGKVIKVVNGDSVGVSGVKVKVGRQIVVTNAEGKYEAKVPDNLPGIVIVPIFGNVGFDSIILNALANNESKRLDFVLQPGSIVAIHGIVKNSNGQPIANAYVSAEWYSSSQQKVVTFTNSLGRFTLPVDASAYYVTLTAKTSTQQATITIPNPSDTTDYVIVMPATPGNNKLTVNGSTIFSIVGIPQGDEVSGSFGGNSLYIYVHVPNSGKFYIYSHNNVQFQISVGQQYSIPSHFTVQYGTQQSNNHDTLQDGTITFTKFSTSQGQLIEGFVSGHNGQNQVTINFSVPISVQKSMILRRQRK